MVTASGTVIYRREDGNTPQQTSSVGHMFKGAYENMNYHVSAWPGEKGGSIRTSGAVSFRAMLVLLLTSIGLLPLFISISLNLPVILDRLEGILAYSQIADLKEKYFTVNAQIIKYSESARLLSDVAGVRDLASQQTNGDVSANILHKRLSNTIRQWFNAKNNVRTVTVMNLSGRELFKMIRDGSGDLKEAAPDQLCMRPDVAGEVETMILDGSNIAVVATTSRITWKGNDHYHHVDVTLGSLVSGYDGKIRGIATLTIDLSKLLERFQYDYIISGNGNYVYNGMSHQKVHTHIPGRAFEDFPGIRELIRKKRPGVTTYSNGQRVAWVPIIMNNRISQNLWSGSVVDSTMIDNMRGVVLKRVLFIAALMFLVVFIVVWRFSTLADRFRGELVQALRKLIENNTPINLRWKKPAEIKELGEEINKLSQRYIAITAQRQEAEDKLAALNRRLNMILENAAEGIIELDAKGNIRFANRAAALILGFEQNELKDNDLHSLVHYLREDRSQYPAEECPFCSAVTSGNYFLFQEDIFWRKDGDPVNVEYLTAPIYDEKKILLGMVMCIRDVTERKKAEKKADDLQKQLLHSQKMEAIGTLAGGVAHDFNNLLTAITGYSELLAMDLEDNEDALKQVKYIAAAARRAAELTGQLLAFSRKQQAEKRIIDINKLIHQQEKMLRRLIGENIKLTTDLCTDTSLNTMADAGMLEQVVMNIVVNARDAMPDGGGIMIRTGKQVVMPGEEYMYEGGHAGDFICITIEDSGMGIDRDTIKQIFNPFFTTKPVDKGTGLGLSVVYGIIEQHGGWINVYSEQGRGTVFKIYLPMLNPDSAGGGNKDLRSAWRKSMDVKGKGRKILMLEDDVMVREIGREILESHDFDVTVAGDIKEARKIFHDKDGCFDLVMSDVILPDGNGLRFIDWVLEQAPDTPVLLASGYIGESSHVTEIRMRGLPFVQKPFHVDELVAAVDAAIRGKG